MTAAEPPADTPHDVDADRYAKVLALNAYLFEELQFAGNETDYEDPRNSFLNAVLDRRTGIPITLSLLYIEVARRAGLPVEGVNFPGHFLLRCRARRSLAYAEDLIIDPFHGGALLSRERLAREASGDQRERDQAESDADDEDVSFESRLLPRATKPQILARMLANLKRIYVRMQSFPQARSVLDLLLAIDPSATTELRDRGLLAYHLNDVTGALRDLQTYLKLIPSGSSGHGRPGGAARSANTWRIWEHVKTLRKTEDANWSCACQGLGRRD